jgi:hypothetical protein
LKREASGYLGAAPVSGKPARVMNLQCGVIVADGNSFFDIEEPCDFPIIEFLAGKLRASVIG